MPPGRTQTSRTTTLSVKVPLELDDLIHAAAERELMSKSDIIRAALLARFESDLAEMEAAS